MARSVTLSFPPFTRAIKVLLAINAGVFFLILGLSAIHQNELATHIFNFLALRAHDVVTGRIYELLTYGFLHVTFFHLLFNLLALWMFGSMLESTWGSRRFCEFFLFGIVGAGLGTVLLAYTLGPIVHLTPTVPTGGASGGIYAILMAAAMLFGDQEVFMFPLPFTIRLKYMVGILAFIALVGAIGDAGGTANVAHLSGLLFGYLYIKFVPRRGLLFGFTEASYGMQNRYHRWQRRRAGKKFQVYMKKHNQDPSDYFDEHGNFRPPEDKDKRNGGDSGGWVN